MAENGLNTFGILLFQVKNKKKSLSISSQVDQE